MYTFLGKWDGLSNGKATCGNLDCFCKPKTMFAVIMLQVFLSQLRLEIVALTVSLPVPSIGCDPNDLITEGQLPNQEVSTLLTGKRDNGKNIGKAQ